MAHFMTRIPRYVYLGTGVILGRGRHQECENGTYCVPERNCIVFADKGAHT